LVSGLHASVNMHIDSAWIDADTKLKYANYTRYYEHFGQHPERIKNMYLVFAVVNRAVGKVKD